MGADGDEGHMCTTLGTGRRPLLWLVVPNGQGGLHRPCIGAEQVLSIYYEEVAEESVPTSHQVTAQVPHPSETHQIALAILQRRLSSTGGNPRKAIPPIEEMTGCQRSFLSLLVDLPTHPK